MDPDEARRQSLLAFGGVERTKEEVRQVRGARWFDETAQDVRLAVRSLAGRPGFTLVALLVLGLGIGATTAMFSTIRSVLLNPLPYADAERIVIGRKSYDGGQTLSGPVSGYDYYDYEVQSGSFEEMAMMTSFTVEMTATGGDSVRAFRSE